MHIIKIQEVFKIFSCSIYKSLVTDHNKYKAFFCTKYKLWLASWQAFTIFQAIAFVSFTSSRHNTIFLNVT